MARALASPSGPCVLCGSRRDGRRLQKGAKTLFLTAGESSFLLQKQNGTWSGNRCTALLAQRGVRFATYGRYGCDLRGKACVHFVSSSD